MAVWARISSLGSTTTGARLCPNPTEIATLDVGPFTGSPREPQFLGLKARHWPLPRSARRYFMNGHGLVFRGSRMRFDLRGLARAKARRPTLQCRNMGRWV